MKYNSFVKEHRDITLSGTKRYENKSGEYYLQNLDRNQKNNLNFTQKSITSLNFKNINNDYDYNKHIIKVKKKKLCDELIPIPIVKQNNKIKNEFEKKNINNAMDNAKYIRRFQYSNNISQRQIQQYKEMKKNEKIFFDKIKFIQIWWKTIFQIIKIQKYLRGYLYRIKLISILDQKELYIDNVLNLVKCLKKIFLYKYFDNLKIYKNYKKYYFHRWNEIINKSIILKTLKNNYDSYKLFKLFKNNSKTISSNSYDKYNNKYEEIDFESDFSDNLKNKNNKSLIEIYNKGIQNQKNRRKKNLSSSSFILKPKKKNLNIGIELSSSQIIRTKKKAYDFNQTNYNKKAKPKIKNKKINIFQHLKKTGNKKNDNIKNLIKIKNGNKSIIKQNLNERYQKEKSFNDLINKKTNYKSKYNNSNKKISFLKNNKNTNNELTKSSKVNSFNRNKRISVGTINDNNKIKNDLGFKTTASKLSESNLNDNSSTIVNNKNKKKIKVYENKLNYYNKKNQLENNIEKEFLSIDKDNNFIEKFHPYTESIFNESQFSGILDSSTINNNKNAIICNNEEAKINYKKIRSNSCADPPPLINKETFNKGGKLDIIKNYFSNWIKKTIFRSLLNKLSIIKNMILTEKIIEKVILTKSFIIIINKYKIRKFFQFLDILKKAIFIKEISLLSKKHILLKYFNAFKVIIDKKIIFEKLLEYKRINLKKKNRGIKKRNKNRFIYSDYDLDNDNYMTEILSNNYDNNFINNNINLNNNTNNCYIINNLNYNENTNKIEVGLTYESENDFNNNTNKHNTIQSLGKIRSKLIELPQNIYKQKKLKQSPALYKLSNNAMINEIFIDNNNFNNDDNTIENSKLINYNTKSNISKNNKRAFIYKHNLSKSVIISINKDNPKPDITTQNNQLIMVINIIERHRKSNKYNLSLSYFKKWKEILNYNIHNNNDNNLSINMRNIKNIKKEQNSFQNNTDKIISFSGGTTDFEDLTKNSIGTDGFRTESDSKSENKISIKPFRIISNNKLSSENSRGIYKKKTISSSSNKALSFAKKNKINISNDNLLIENNDMQLNNIRFSTHTISYNYDIQESIKKEIENNYGQKRLSDKSLNLVNKNNDNQNILEYTSPEEYLGFKKSNKIQEMEISFAPLNENQKNNEINNNIKNNINSFNNNSNYNNKGNEYNNNYKKEVIIEAIEEYNENEYDGDNVDIIHKIRNEFNNFEQIYLYKSFSYIKRSYNIKIEEKKRVNKSMNDII